MRPVTHLFKQATTANALYKVNPLNSLTVTEVAGPHEITSLIYFLLKHPGITTLSLGQVKNLSNESLFELARGMKTLNTLEKLEVDGQALSSRAPEKRKGLISLLTALKDNQGLTVFSTATIVPKSKADYYPLQQDSVSLIASLAAEHPTLQTMKFPSLWVPREAKEQLLKPLELCKRIIPSIEFENLKLNPSTLATELAAENKSTEQDTKALTNSLLSVKPVAFRN